MEFLFSIIGILLAAMGTYFAYWSKKLAAKSNEKMDALAMPQIGAYSTEVVDGEYLVLRMSIYPGNAVVVAHAISVDDQLVELEFLLPQFLPGEREIHAILRDSHNTHLRDDSVSHHSARRKSFETSLSAGTNE